MLRPQNWQYTFNDYEDLVTILEVGGDHIVHRHLLAYYAHKRELRYQSL